MRCLDRCREPFERYVGGSWLESGLDLFVIGPAAESWAAGDREYLCSAAPLDGEPLKGSVEETGGILGSDERTRFNLSVGDCYDDPGSRDALVVELVACEAPHDNEVFAIVDLPAAPVAVYPGDEELQAMVDQTDAREFERRVDPKVGPRLDHLSLWPNRFTWALGERSIVHILYDRTLAKLEGSMLRS